MKTLPPVIIATDRGHLIAYRLEEGDRPRVLATEEFTEGNTKLSDLVTDQAGAFPMTGSIGTGSAERMPLVAELEMRCFRKISEKIHSILRDEKAGRWALVAPSEIHGAIVDFLAAEDRETLALQLKRNLVKVPSKELVEALHQEAGRTAWD
jgi:hypothetical protein